MQLRPSIRKQRPQSTAWQMHRILAADSAEDVAAALSAAQNNIQGIISAYNEAYDAALKSVSGQYDLWDTAEKIVATSASSINSALESQITYWDSYNQNLESLNARAADIDGLSAVIASFADGSKDSVNAIAGMASASDADLAKMVQNYQELQEAQKTTSESMADLETGMSNAMDEIAQNVADSVADMNLSDEAKESAQATIQGFVDGAEGMLPRVQTVFSKIASAASTALAGAGGSYSGNIPGYAVGTESAAPGFAIVGENGPELVYFNGGETVLTAPETRAASMKRSSSRRSSAKTPLTLQPFSKPPGCPRIPCRRSTMTGQCTTSMKHSPRTPPPRRKLCRHPASHTQRAVRSPSTSPLSTTSLACLTRSSLKAS